MQNATRIWFAVALVATMGAVLAGQASGQPTTPPLSVRLDACKRVGEIVSWVYKQRNSGTDRNAVTNVIRDLDINDVLGSQIESYTDEQSREGLRNVVLKMVEQAYSRPQGATRPNEAGAYYFQGCAEGAAKQADRSQ
ncbi:hypothetical protein [Ralstonia pseudosolanacearum]|uniref:hypothetical protein n=1 Tax=Ralstonia pseudosolanacearum TaxID=1310165 RepID=UPI0011CE8AB2|nr:hypothetical protein [Ralstonia pseudosolanacearum]